MFQNLLSLQQTSDVPQLALIAEGSALLVFLFLSLNLFFKWRKNRRDATLNLFLSFLFYIFAVGILFSTKSLDYFSGGELNVSTVGINLGYAFSIIGNIFLYYFTEDIFYEQEQKMNIVSAYLQNKSFLIPNILSVKAGIRGAYYNRGKRFSIDPRLGIKYLFKPNTAFNLAVGKYSQFLVTINSQESYFSIFDFWRPVAGTHEIPTAYHAVAGFEQWFDEKTKFTIEPYYKKYYNKII